MKARLGELYKQKISKSMQDKFAYKNANMIPRLTKITVNCCSRDVVLNGKVIDSIVADIASITGQKPVITRARKSIASFKLREGQALGASVTLRGSKMYEFLDRLVTVALPRVRDFRGVPSKGFDGNGNYTLGLKEQILFPEINYDKIDKIRGLNISIQTTASKDEEARELLTLFGVPFRK